MTYLRTVIFILLGFALHIGCTAIVHVGLPPQPLVLLVVLAVWLARVPAISRVILPAAFLVDIIQAAQVPLVSAAVLVAWFVAALIQRQWLTNHSLVSLLGLTIVVEGATVLTTTTFIWLAHSVGLSATPLGVVWSASGFLQRVGFEVGLTVLAGAFIRSFARFLRSRFLYASP